MILELPFDQYQRYKIVQEAIDVLRDKDRLKILDVGGYPGQILDFLPNDEILVVDQVEDEKEHYQKADALNLPFEDRAFDFVVSVDCFEHILPADRKKFLTEISRVADKAVLLAAPFDHPDVVAAEQSLDRHYRECLIVHHQFLTEHLENGLPDREKTIVFFEDQGFKVVAFPNGYLERWLPMMMTYGSLSRNDKNKVFLEQINRFYNRHLYEYDNCEPCYRYLLVAIKDSKLTGRPMELGEKLIKDDNEDLKPTMQLQNLALLSAVALQGASIEKLEQELLLRQHRINELEHEFETYVAKVQGTIVYKAFKFLKKFKN